MVDGAEEAVDGAGLGLGEKGVEGAGGVGGYGFGCLQVELVLEGQVVEEGGKQEGEDKEGS